jgi:hypothetical protein
MELVRYDIKMQIKSWIGSLGFKIPLLTLKNLTVAQIFLLLCKNGLHLWTRTLPPCILLKGHNLGALSVPTPHPGVYLPTKFRESRAADSGVTGVQTVENGLAEKQQQADEI